MNGSPHLTLEVQGAHADRFGSRREQVFDERQAGGVDPLQIIEDKHVPCAAGLYALAQQRRRRAKRAAQRSRLAHPTRPKQLT